eukprot:TRINITY_DN2581_c1_g1_i3.p1 TRINITY_DN2581_c1_g1~~TRINITY_DN2581_c1_g1_i3.p1  ORF type:complete len:907 (-),score=213.75 TRINITY_DN2581_c1_g1_i3:554-3274(-)
MSAMTDIAIRALQVQTMDEAGASCEEKLEMNGASDAAQIVQGVGFLGLAIFLIFVNNAKIGTNAKAPLEARYTVCCTIATAVCLFSGFFNILQMTKLDDFDLPRSTKFTLDLSRPVEWVLTCPIMQLCLVILGGARIPSYRRFLMPLLTASNLLCGVAAMFSEDGMKWVWFAFGFTIWSLYTYYNAQQIVENSDGEESVFKGDSDYRKLTVIVMITWFPFPLWFFMSPEGFGAITDVTTIQLGWAVLNIVSKFGFILHLQYIKNQYCKKLDAARELYGVQPGGQIPDELVQGKGGAPRDTAAGENDEDSDGENKIKVLISETMISLGLASHIDRFTKLVLDAGINSTDILERVNQDRAIDLDLPWSLVDAVQRRWRSEKMDLGQDQGGVVEKEDPFKKLLQESKSRKAQKEQMQGMMRSGSNFHHDGMSDIPGGAISGMGMGMYAPPVAMATADLAPIHQRMDEFSHLFEQMMSKLDTMSSSIDHLESKVDTSQEAVCQRMDFSQISLLQTVNSCQVLLHKIDSSQEGVVRQVDDQKDTIRNVSASQEKLLEVVTGSSDSAKQALLDTVTSSSEELLKKMHISQAELLTKATESQEVLVQVSKNQEHMARKMDSHADAATRSSVESESRIFNKVDTMSADVLNVCTTEVGKLGKSLNKEVQKLTETTERTTNCLNQGMDTQEERMADITRQNMMVMDMLTNTQDSVSASAQSIDQFKRAELMSSDARAKSQACNEVALREVMTAELSRFQHNFKSLLTGDQPEDESGTGILATMAEPFQAQANRIAALAEKLESQNMSTVGGAGGSTVLEDTLRNEMAAMGLVLAQQQRNACEEQSAKVSKEVGEAIRGELQQSTDRISDKIDVLGQNVDEGLQRVGEGLETLSSAKINSSAAPEKESRRRSADRG